MNPDANTPPETLLSALLFLLSRYGQQPCPRLALGILQHLDWIAADMRQPAALRHTARGLAQSWRWRLGKTVQALH